MRLAPAVPLLAVAAAAAVVWLRSRSEAPPIEPPAVAAPDAARDATAASTAPVSLPVATTAPDPAVTGPARDAAPAVIPPWTPAADALFAKARDDTSLTLVVAEITAVGTIARNPFDREGLEYQNITLFVLLPTDDRLVRQYAMLEVPLCPTESETRYGCATPFHALQPGQVRTFVLAQGRPNLGGLGKLAGRHARWLALAGPEVPRPPDAVLARVPDSLRPHLGRPGAAVFAGRVVDVHAPQRTSDLRRAFPRLVVDVTDVAHHENARPPSGRIRFVQEPFVSGLDYGQLEVGRVYWFAADGAGPLQVLRAFAAPH